MFAALQRPRAKFFFNQSKKYVVCREPVLLALIFAFLYGALKVFI